MTRVIPALGWKLSSLHQKNAAWGRGYFTDLHYGSFCFREVAPVWLDYAVLNRRCSPPLKAEGGAFSYLELGSGMGLGLCLLAAAYPEAAFIGIDFHPSHVAHSQWLKAELRLPNIQFYEADFLEMASASFKSPFQLDHRFHYVAAHGILSWINSTVRDALFSIASTALQPGGIFYCSYNTYPGWLERSAFKALLDLELNRLGGSQFADALGRSIQVLQSLLDTNEVGPSPLGKAFPRLSSQLQAISDINQPDYLCAEYGSDNWQPFYVGDVHRQASAHKLSFVASASLPENHPNLLPPALAAVVCDESDPLIQQTLFDLAINQSFRRDLFVKGNLRLSQPVQQHRLAALGLRLTTPKCPTTGDQASGVSIDTSLGVISDLEGRFQQIEALLALQPTTLAQIHQALGISPESLVPLVSLLLHSGRVGFDRGSAVDNATASCTQVNERMMSLMQAGHNLAFLAAPNVGHGAQPFSPIDAFILAGIRQGLDGEVLASCVLMGLDAAGIELSHRSDGPMTEPEQRYVQITNHIKTFCQAKLHRLVQLGIVREQEFAG